MPPRARRSRAGRDLPPEARRRGSSRRRAPTAAARAEAEERQAHRLHRRRPRVAHGRERPDAARLRSHDLREVGHARRPHAHEHSVLPPARARARGGDRLHHRFGGGPASGLTGDEHASSCSHPASSTQSLSAAARRKARTSTCPAAAPLQPSSEHIHIGIDWLESVAFDHIKAIGRKRADHRRRQHRDGLLPHFAAPRRRRREGHGAQAARLLQGFRVGAGRRRGRERRDRRQSRAEGVRDRGRQAHRHAVRQDGIRPRRQGPHHRRAHRRRAVLPLRRRDPGDRPGERVPVDRERSRHRVRQVARAEGRQGHVPVDAAGSVLRRRRGVRPEEHHLGGRARPSGGDLDSQVLPGADA